MGISKLALVSLIDGFVEVHLFGREIQTRSTWQSRCVLRGCVGVGAVHTTWHRICVLRPPVPKCPPAQW